MNDEEAEHPHHFLHREVRVIEKRAVLVNAELVDESAARGHGVLRDTRHTVHLDGHLEPMPVDGGQLRQPVLEYNTYPIPLVDLDRRPRDRAVVAPGVDLSAREELGLDYLADKMEFLRPVDEFIG